MQPSLKDLNLAPNLFNVLATLAVIQPDDENNPQSPELSHPSPVSTPPVNLNTIEGWETAHTATDDNTFCSEDEPARVYWDKSPKETFDPQWASKYLSLRARPPHHRLHHDKRGSWALGCLFLKTGSVAAHLRIMRPAATSNKDTLLLKENSNINTINQTVNFLLLD